jgi:hypothetical protein
MLYTVSTVAVEICHGTDVAAVVCSMHTTLQLHFQCRDLMHYEKYSLKIYSQIKITGIISMHL